MLTKINVNNVEVAVVDSSAVAKSKNLINSNAVKDGKVIPLSYFGENQTIAEAALDVSDGQYFVAYAGNEYHLAQKDVEIPTLGYREIQWADDCLYVDTAGQGYTYDFTDDKLKSTFGKTVRFDDQELTYAQQDQARRNLGFVVLTESEYEAMAQGGTLDASTIYMTVEEE